MKPCIKVQVNAALDCEIGRLADAYERAGYTFHDTRPALSDHIAWVYQRLAYRKPCWAIAADAFTTEANVKLRTRALGDELGLSRFPTARKVWF